MQFSLDQFYRINRRALIWIILFALLWLLRDFLGLIFLTFVLAFIAAPLARFGQQWLRLPRRASIVAVYVFFLAALIGLIGFVTPRVVREATGLVGNLSQIDKNVTTLKNNLVSKYPGLKDVISSFLESALSSESTEKLKADTKILQSSLGLSDAALLGREDLPSTDTQTRDLISQFDVNRDELLVQSFMAQQMNLLKKKIPEVLISFEKKTVTTLLALLFSFLISMDLVRLSQEVASLRDSRLKDFYEQTAQPVVRFGYVVGRALQAQALIACANTVLTLIGLIILGLPSLAMLSLVVFSCSFIPVLGVFISTVPMLLVALNRGGVGLAVGVVVMVCVIHLIEAYVLNPIIYGRHLKLNPVVVLIILFVGHHLFGLWGMLLGVPVAHYFLHDVFGVPVWDESRLAPTAAHSLSALPRTQSTSQEDTAAHPEGRGDASR